MELSYTEGEDYKKSLYREEHWEFSFGNTNFVLPIRTPSGDADAK